MKGYDDWKMMSPDEERGGADICPFCGAYSKRSCEMIDEMGICPWDESETDPDELRDLRDSGGK